MCGIVGAVSARNIVPILVQGLQRLEYRGYDSCGVAVYSDGLKRARSTDRVAKLLAQVEHDAAYVLAYCDGGYTTNLPLDDLTGGRGWLLYLRAP